MKKIQYWTFCSEVYTVGSSRPLKYKKKCSKFSNFWNTLALGARNCWIYFVPPIHNHITTNCSPNSLQANIFNHLFYLKGLSLWIQVTFCLNRCMPDSQWLNPDLTTCSSETTIKNSKLLKIRRFLSHTFLVRQSL